MPGAFNPSLQQSPTFTVAIPAAPCGLRLFRKKNAPKPPRLCNCLRKPAEYSTGWMRNFGAMYLQAMQCQCRGRQSHHRRYGVPSAPPADTSSGRKSVSLPERFHTASFIRSAGYDRAFASSVSAESEGYYKDDPYKHLLVQTLTDRLAEAATERCTNMCARQSGDMLPMNRFPFRICWLRNIRASVRQ